MARSVGAGTPPHIAVYPIAPSDRDWAKGFLLTHNHSLRVVSRGVLHQVIELPGFVGLLKGAPSALLTYQLANVQQTSEFLENSEVLELEVVTLHAAQRRRGLGSALLEAARAKAGELGCRRLWLITTDDNEPAIAFYKRRGMSLVAVHENALEQSRALKPEIPLTGLGGKPLRDEIEFEYRLQ